jgi:hypothetical protein
MKKIVSRFGSSSYIQIVIRGITLLLATLAIVSAQNAGSPGDKPVVAQENPWGYASVSAQEKFQRTRIAPEALPGPVNVEEVDQAGMVPASLTANALINNNNGSTGAAYFTQSETTLVAFGTLLLPGSTTRARSRVIRITSPGGHDRPMAVSPGPTVARCQIARRAMPATRY